MKKFLLKWFFFMSLICVKRFNRFFFAYGRRYTEVQRIPSMLPPPREEKQTFNRYLYTYPADYGNYYFTKLEDKAYWKVLEGEKKILPIEAWQWDRKSERWIWGPLTKQDGTPLLPVSPELEAPRPYVGPVRIYGPIQIDDLPIPRVLDILCRPYESLIGIRAWFPNPDSRGRKDLRGIQFLCSSALDIRGRRSKSSTWSKIMGSSGSNLKKYTVLTRPEDPFVKIRIFIETLNPIKHPSQREVIIPTYQGPKLAYIDNEDEMLEKGPIYLIRKMTFRTKNNHLSFLGRAGGDLPSVVEEAPPGYELSGFRVLISGYPRGTWKGSEFSTLTYRNSMSLGLLFAKTEDILSRPQVIYGRRGYDFQDIKCDGKVTGLQGYFMGNRGLVGLKVECDKVWQNVVIGITEGTDYKVLVGRMVSAVTLHLSPEKFIQSLVIFSTSGRQQMLGNDWIVPTIKSTKSENGGRRILQGIFAELDKIGAISGIGFHWTKPPKAGEVGDREDLGYLEQSESPVEEDGSISELGSSGSKEQELVPKSSFYGRVAKGCPIKETRCPKGVPLTGIRLILRKGEVNPKPFKMFLVSLTIQCGEEFFKPIGNPNLFDKEKLRTYDILVHEEDPIVDFKVYLGDLGLPHLFDIRFKHDVLSKFELYGFRSAMMIKSDRIGAIAPLYRTATPIDIPPITAKDISIKLFGAVRPDSDPDINVLETSCPQKIPITAVRMWFVRKIEGSVVFSRLIGLRIRCGNKWRKTKLGSSMGDRFEAEIGAGDFISRAFVENQSEKPFYTSGIMLVTLNNRKAAFGETSPNIMKKLASGDVETEIYGFIGQEGAEGLVSIGFLVRQAPSKDYPNFKNMETMPYIVDASSIFGNKNEIENEEERLAERGVVDFRPGEEWFGRRGLTGSHSEETFCSPGKRLTGILVHSSIKTPQKIVGLTLICDGNPLPPVGSTLGDVARYEIPANEPIEKVEVVLNNDDRSISRIKLFNRNHMKKRMAKLHDRYLSGFDVEIKSGIVTALSAIYTNYGDSGPPPKIRVIPGSNKVGGGTAPLTDRKTPWGHANSDGDVSTDDEYSCEEGTKLTRITVAYQKEQNSPAYALVGLRISCNDEDYEEVGNWEPTNGGEIMEESFELGDNEYVISIGGTRVEGTQSVGKLYFETNLLRQFGEWQQYYVEAPTRGHGLYGFELLFEKTGDYSTPIAMILPLFRQALDSKETEKDTKNASPFELPGSQPESSEEVEEREKKGLLNSPTLTTDWMGLEIDNLEMDGIWCKTSRLKLDGRMTWDDWRNSRLTGLRIYNDGDHIKGIQLQCGNAWLEEAYLGLIGPNFHFDVISDCTESDVDYIESVDVALDSRGIPVGFRLSSSTKRQKKALINSDSLVNWQSNAPQLGSYYASGLHVEFDPDTNIIFRVRIVYRPIVSTQENEEPGLIF